MNADTKLYPISRAQYFYLAQPQGVKAYIIEKSNIRETLVDVDRVERNESGYFAVVGDARVMLGDETYQTYLMIDRPFVPSQAAQDLFNRNLNPNSHEVSEALRQVIQYDSVTDWHGDEIDVSNARFDIEFDRLIAALAANIKGDWSKVAAMRSALTLVSALADGDLKDVFDSFEELESYIEELNGVLKEHRRVPER